MEAEVSRSLRERTAIEAALRAYGRREVSQATEATAARMDECAVEGPKLAGECAETWRELERLTTTLGDAFRRVQRLNAEAIRCAREVHQTAGGHLDSPAGGEAAFDGGTAITLLGGLLWRAVGGDVSLTRPMGGADPLDVLASHVERVDAAGGAIAEAAVRVADKTRAALQQAA